MCLYQVFIGANIGSNNPGFLNQCTQGSRIFEYGCRKDVQGVRWMPKAEEVATCVAKKCLDFVSRVQVDSLQVLVVLCKDLEFHSQCMVTKFSYYASSSCTCNTKFGITSPRGFSSQEKRNYENYTIFPIQSKNLLIIYMTGKKRLKNSQIIYIVGKKY